MKRLIATLLLGMLAACGGSAPKPTATPCLLPLSETEVGIRLPYLGFYDTTVTEAILRFETEAGSVFAPARGDANTLAFETKNGDYPLTDYTLRSSRMLLAASLYGASQEVVWNRNLVRFLEEQGFVLTDTSDVAIRMTSHASGVEAELMRITADGRSLVRFTPMREQPALPATPPRLIHPFHTLGAGVQEIYEAELAEGRQLKVAEEGRLYLTFPEEGTLFERFGFFVENDALYKVMSILYDGSYLDTQECLDEMATEGFLYLRQDGLFRYFRSADGSVVVRSANAAPYPTIEYLDPSGAEAE